MEDPSGASFPPSTEGKGRAPGGLGSYDSVV